MPYEATSDPTMFAVTVGEHLDRYPHMQLEDLYKLTHHASFGSGHAISDPAFAIGELYQEISQLGVGPDEPALDFISPDHKIARVHLRPYLRNGGEPHHLAEAFVRTANEFQGSAQRFRNYWEILEAVSAAGHLPFSDSGLCTLGRNAEAHNYPPIHHSDQFRSIYRPGYRVVAPEFLPPEALAAATRPLEAAVS